MLWLVPAPSPPNLSGFYTPLRSYPLPGETFPRSFGPLDFLHPEIMPERFYCEALPRRVPLIETLVPRTHRVITEAVVEEEVRWEQWLEG